MNQTITLFLLVLFPLFLFARTASTTWEDQPIDQDNDLDMRADRYLNPGANHFVPRERIPLPENVAGILLRDVADWQGNWIRTQYGMKNLETQLADLDQDGDLDLVGAAWDQDQFMHFWWNNQLNHDDE